MIYYRSRCHRIIQPVRIDYGEAVMDISHRNQVKLDRNFSCFSLFTRIIILWTMNNPFGVRFREPL